MGSLLSLGALFSTPAFGQVGVNGVIGAEWAGVTPQHVFYSSTAPTSNFGSPTNLSNTVAYDVYIRKDGNFVYGAIATLPAGSGLDAWTTNANFVNLYLGLNVTHAPGSTLGFEFGNDRAFVPGRPDLGPAGGYASASLSSQGFAYTLAPGLAYGGGGAGPDGSQGAVAEWAIPWSYFEALTNPASVGFSPAAVFPVVDRNDDTTNAIRFNLSQSFGLSVNGGNAFYGYSRLGVIPEPATYLAGLLALGALGGEIRRRRAKHPASASLAAR